MIRAQNLLNDGAALPLAAGQLNGIEAGLIEEFEVIEILDDFVVGRFGVFFFLYNMFLILIDNKVNIISSIKRCFQYKNYSFAVCTLVNDMNRSTVNFLIAIKILF